MEIQPYLVGGERERALLHSDESDTSFIGFLGEGAQQTHQTYLSFSGVAPDRVKEKILEQKVRLTSSQAVNTSLPIV